MKVSDIIRIPEIETVFPKPGNYEEIKADIAERGIQEPVVVNTANQLLCGYTRLAIAEDLGLEDIPHRSVDVSEPTAMIEYAILDNIRRRQLTDLQLVEYGIKLEEVYGNRQGQRSDLGTECPEVKSGRTRDIVAAEIVEKTGAKMSGKKYSRLRTIATKAASEVKAALNNGQISQQKALSLCKLDHQVQLVFLNGELPESMTSLNDGEYNAILTEVIDSMDNRLKSVDSIEDPMEQLLEIMAIRNLAEQGQKVAAQRRLYALWGIGQLMEGMEWSAICENGIEISRRDWSVAAKISELSEEDFWRYTDELIECRTELTTNIFLNHMREERRIRNLQQQQASTSPNHPACGEICGEIL
jgi:hypothetical protein